jgi:hypothetical protein
MLSLKTVTELDSPTVIDNHHWIWQGTVESVTWKYARVVWTHSNSPVFPGPIVEDDRPSRRRLGRAEDDATISLLTEVSTKESMTNDYYSKTKCPCKPCKIQTCDSDSFGPIIVQESAPIWDDASFAFSLAIAANQATFVKGRFVQVVDMKGSVQS